MLKNVFTALVTPFAKNKIDFLALTRLIKQQINAKVAGIVICGSTGESFNLQVQEQKEIITAVTEQVNGKIKVFVGTLAMNNLETLYLIEQAAKLKVDGVMIVTPPYIKPEQRAIYNYFEQIHNNCDLPIIIYDNPGRSGIKINTKILIDLLQMPRFIALKDASGDLTRPSELLAKIPLDTALLSGDDITSAAFLAQGGHGVISVSANVVPQLLVQQFLAWEQANLVVFSKLRQQLFELHKAMFCESNPVPVKYALSLLKYCNVDVRLPLLNISADSAQIIQYMLANLQLIEQ